MACSFAHIKPVILGIAILVGFAANGDARHAFCPHTVPDTPSEATRVLGADHDLWCVAGHLVDRGAGPKPQLLCAVDA